ncbi:MAG: alpha-2-macroglobulin family protein [Parabacteroides sp.]
MMNETDRRNNWLCTLWGLLCLMYLASGCSFHRSSEEPLPYHPCVEAFTSGKISRYSPVYLIFNQEVDSTLRPLVAKQMSIRPAVKGTFRFENGRTVVFEPAQSLERNRTYQVTADLGRWFDLEGAERKFTFQFSTLPTLFRAHLQSMEVNRKQPDCYDFNCVLYSPDREEAVTVESLMKWSEQVETQWSHSPDGKRHELRVVGVPAGPEQERYIALSVGANKWDVPEKELIQLRVPQKDHFSLYDVRYEQDPERFVELTFTRRLDGTQEMRGLARLADNTTETVTTEDNKLRLYPDPGRKGVVSLFLSRDIRSEQGETLGKDMEQEVSIGQEVPAVRFVGRGVIIPQSEELSVPFQAVYLRGVVVRVIRILQQNVGLFLQENDLDSQGYLLRVGRLVARKTLLFDDPSLDLSQWNTFSVDLRKLIEPEPGAIYRVELSFDRRLSAYPCGETEPLTQEQVAAEDALRFQEECDHYDGGYYYNVNEQDWSLYNYREREDPCKPSFYFNTAVGRNVLATDIGLMAFSDGENSLRVLAHQIRTTQPLKQVEVAAYNYQGQLLTQGTTDKRGEVCLSFPSGRPYYLIASQGQQRSYLRVDNASALSLSLFDVEGEVVQKGLKGFVYGERGVWRPGDTLHLGFLLNDRQGTLPERHPVVMELYNPLGQLYARQTQNRGEMGLYAFSFATESDAPTGAWQVKVNVGGTSFQKGIRIESIKPNRLKIDLSLPDLLVKGEPMDGRLHVEWLQGATARRMKYDIQGVFISTKTRFNGYEAYQFDDPGRSFNSEESRLISGTTDEAGNAQVRAALEVGHAAPGMLLGQVTTRVYEESGDFSLDATRILYSPFRRYVGVRSPQQGDEPLPTGQTHSFQVVTVNEQGRAEAGTEVEAILYKMDWYGWWSSDRSLLANYVADSYHKPVRRFTLHTDTQGKATLDLKVEREDWGRYYLILKDKQGGHSTGLITYFDWPDLEGRRDSEGGTAAQMLTFRTDKSDYRPGEEMVIVVPSSSGSRAIVSVENGTRVLSLEEVECQALETTVRVKVTPEMQPNSYVHITLLQPYTQVANDLPIRLYGVVPVTVTDPGSRLQPVIQVADEIRPEADYTVTVSERTGRPMAYTLAVVDEGLLDLTRFATPDPWAAFHAREALGVHAWDLYNYVLGAYGGSVEQLFSIGGDDALKKGPKAIVNRFPPVVRFEGPFRLKPGEKRTHHAQMPNYNGRVRVMVVAGDGEAYGNAEQSVLVRKPLMLLGTLPRVIGTGEEMIVPATLFATVPDVGDVTVSIACPAGMEVVGEKSRQLHFREIGDQQALFRIRTQQTPGTGRIVLTARSQNDQARYSAELAIRSVSEKETRVIPVTLEPGKSWKQSLPLEGLSGSRRVSLEMAHVQPVNLTQRLAYLSDYPHGCLEQLVSRAFPLLYVGQWAGWDAEQQQMAEKRVKEVIGRLRSYQTTTGGFSYWPGQTADQVWGTAYAAHFLLQAESKGYWLPSGLKSQLMNYLHRVSRGWKATEHGTCRLEEESEAYRLFVLALAGEAEPGAMNRMKEQTELTEVSRDWLASAYACLGQTEVSRQLLTRTYELTGSRRMADATFGCDLRDKAIRLMTYTRLQADAEAAALADQLSGSLASDEWFSTHAVAFAVAAVAEFRNAHPQDERWDFSYQVGTQKGRVQPKQGTLWSGAWSAGGEGSLPVELTNHGASTLYARLTIEGEAAPGRLQPAAQGLQLAATYTDSNGQPLAVESLEQGTSFTLTVTVKNPSPEDYAHLVLTQIVPAGWEVLNTRYLADTPTAGTVGAVDYQDIRDDRIYSYINHLPAGRQVTLSVRLCAVYPGRFYLPAVRCEAMYDAHVQAHTGSGYVTVK